MGQHRLKWARRIEAHGLFRAGREFSKALNGRHVIGASAVACVAMHSSFTSLVSVPILEARWLYCTLPSSACYTRLGTSHAWSIRTLREPDVCSHTLVQRLWPCQGVQVDG